MTDDHYKFAELGNEPELLDSIQQLEEKISEKHGRPVTLIAYEKEAVEQ